MMVVVIRGVIIGNIRNMVLKINREILYIRVLNYSTSMMMLLTPIYCYVRMAYWLLFSIKDNRETKLSYLNTITMTILT